MTRISSGAAIGAAITMVLSGCGGSDNGSPPPPPPPPGQTSFVGSIGPASAWAETNGSALAGPTLTYAGKRQMQRGNVDPMTNSDVGMATGVQVFKASDGHVYGVDLTSTAAPAPVQRSTEAMATVDPLCSSTGTSMGGSSYDYAGVFFAADLAQPANSTYAYRLPGPDGVCDTPDDIVHVVKTGTDSTVAPAVGVAMPAATVQDATGALTGFIAKSGASLVLTDSNLANPVTVGVFASTVGVASALPIGLASGYPTGRLFVVDGNIVYVNYAAATTSAPLFTIPNWTATNDHLVTAASPTTLYFAVNTPASGSTPASSTIYQMPSDGSAAPVAMGTQTGVVRQMEFAVGGSALVVGTVDVGYSIAAWPAAGGPAMTLMTAPSDNDGRFSVTASDAYYTTWFASSAPGSFTRTGTTSGVVGMDATVVMQPLSDSMFMGGGEADVFAAGDTTTQRTAWVTMFQVQNLSAVTVSDPATGTTFTEDGLSGGTLLAIDTTTNSVAATIGTFPTSLATSLATATYRGIDHTLFLQAVTPLSSQDPTSLDLYLLNSRTPNSLVRATSNL
jgi:hypothetical protein